MTETTAPPENGDTVALYNANDGLRGRDGGPYLDREEQWEAEKRRAYVEDREPVAAPKYGEPQADQLPATAGTQLVTASQLLAGVGVNIPSKSGDSGVAEDEKFVRAIADDDETLLAVHSELPAEAYTSIDAVDTSMQTQIGETESGDYPTQPNEPVDESGPSDVTTDEAGNPREASTVPEQQGTTEENPNSPTFG